MNTSYSLYFYFVFALYLTIYYISEVRRKNSSFRYFKFNYYLEVITMKYSELALKHANDIVRDVDKRNIASLNVGMRSIAWTIEDMLNCQELDYDTISKLNVLYSALANIKAARKEL